MAKIFDNSTEMESYFNKVIEEVIEAVSKDLLDDFLKHLDNTIYKAKPGEYSRYYNDGGFYSGWTISEEINKKIGDYVRSLIFDGNRLIAPQNDMINSQMSHGGNDGSDIRNIMPMVLNNIMDNDFYSYNGGALYLSELNNEGYWDSYTKDLDRKVNKWFNQELNKYGIKRG